VAVRLTALRRGDEAKALLDEAEALEAQSPAMWNGRAVWHSQRGEWKEALDCADRALRGKLEPLSAVATKAQALYAVKEFSAAFDLSRKLVERVPEDPGLLFYHAKIAHEARAFRAEIEALEKLIALAEAARRPTSGYCIYLGQAYAAVSDGKRAIAAFTRALGDPELPKEQREFAADNIRRIKSRVDL
jgi:tetratricopeptide (TPR) repeat protein